VLTTNQKGAIAEIKIAAIAVDSGVGVSIPVADEPYDLILDVGHALLRVQCKWAVRTGDVVLIRCRRCRRGPEGFIHRGYKESEIDAVAAYCRELDEAYLLPVEMSVERAAVQLRLTPTRNNQQAGIHWAQDFELGATLARLLGPIAQLGERLSGTQKVAGSSPAGSTERLF
jgi:hypothetical protein